MNILKELIRIAEILGDENIIAVNESQYQWEYDLMRRTATLTEENDKLKLTIVEMHVKSGLGAGKTFANIYDGFVGTLQKPNLGMIRSILAKNNYEKCGASSSFKNEWYVGKTHNRAKLSAIIQEYLDKKSGSSVPSMSMPIENDKVDFVRKNLDKLNEDEMQLVYDMIKRIK